MAKLDDAVGWIKAHELTACGDDMPEVGTLESPNASAKETCLSGSNAESENSRLGLFLLFVFSRKGGWGGVLP